VPNALRPTLPLRGTIATMPNVSIIIPSYNRTKFLRAAIESVFEQTYTDWEMIIADDGSDEETAAYLRNISAPNVRTLWLPHSGIPSMVRNRALDIAKGRFVAFLDSDDVWSPAKLEKQIAGLRGNPNSRWGYTMCGRIDECGDPVQKQTSPKSAFREGWVFEPLLRLEFSIAMPTLVVDRELICEIGGFDEHLGYGEFHDLCLRLALKSEVVAVHEVLCFVRTHHEHYSSDRLAAHASWMRLYDKMRAITDDPKLRSLCARMRSETSLKIAWLQAQNGDGRQTSATILKAFPFSWRYPKWWLGAVRAVVRSTAPASVLACLRNRRQEYASTSKKFPTE
jgi:glycosyltransferase involved in cell wall biosynthesis